MKKVLILAYDFPPYVSVGGLRPYSWYKYFKEFGLYPIVVTRQWGNKYGNYLDYIAPSDSNETIIEETEYGTIIRTPYKPNLSNRLLLKYGVNKFRFLRKLVTAYYEFMQFLFFVGPKSGLYKGAKRYLENNTVDFIIATGEPFILFKYASKLSARFKTKWLADYRDPWSQSKNRNRNFFERKFNVFFEKKYLKNVTKIITVSEFVKNNISCLIKNKEFIIIRNGYDAENAIEANATRQNSKTLSIAFAGSIYNWHPIDSFLGTLSTFLINNTNINLKLNFYGINKESTIKTKLVELPKLNNITSFTHKLTNKKLLIELSKNNLLLLFNDYSILGTKIFDYLAVKRHIILCFENDKDSLLLKHKHFAIADTLNTENALQAKMIKETCSGTVIVDKQDLLIKLLDFVNEFQTNGEIKCSSCNIENYSRYKQAQLLVNLINNLLC